MGILTSNKAPFTRFCCKQDNTEALHQLVLCNVVRVKTAVGLLATGNFVTALIVMRQHIVLFGADNTGQ